MKKIILFFSLAFIVLGASAQEVVVDPTTSAAILVNADVISNKLNTTNNNLSLIQQGQLAVSGQLVIAVLAIAALAAFAVWEEWLNLIVGLWVLVSPWVLGFQGTTARTVHVIVGILVAILAAIELWLMSQNPPPLTTSR